MRFFRGVVTRIGADWLARTGIDAGVRVTTAANRGPRVDVDRQSPRKEAR